MTPWSGSGTLARGTSGLTVRHLHGGARPPHRVRAAPVGGAGKPAVAGLPGKAGNMPDIGRAVPGSAGH
ncbi:MAG: hypothetical protein LBT40_04480 [Deltaproteobacteria bacterium]|nr:hypothetical protein [Deltaproteobacteria bacterium]